MTSESTVHEIVPGPDGDPVPDGIRIFRMANEPKLERLSESFRELLRNGRALPTFFELSSEDRRQSVPRLSVWVEGLTTFTQAWMLTGSNPVKRWVAILEADTVRKVFAPGSEGMPDTAPLDVQFETAYTVGANGESMPDIRPGASGHAGITKLDGGNKLQRLSLRIQLALAASVRILGPEELHGNGVE